MSAEQVLRTGGGWLAFAGLAVVLYGAWRATRRRAGRMLGARARWLGIPWFYLVSTAIFLAACIAMWRPLPLPTTPRSEVWTCALGSLLYFPAMLFALWGRLTLGQNYGLSTALAVRLFKDHELVRSGPFAIVRHPMYVGLIVSAVGAVLLYQTWTTVVLALMAPMLLLRARMEERVLSIEFGEAWKAYCAQVPMLVPRLRGQQRRVKPDERL